MRLIRTLLTRELLALGLNDLRAHKLRSFLTALGMIFGVGAVICMLSIGEGASADELESIRLLGSQNIIVRSVEPPASQQARDQTSSIKEYGIRRADVQRLRRLPGVGELVLVRDVADTVTRGARKFDGHVLGVSHNLFSVVGVEVERGRALREADDAGAEKVCVLGADVAQALFRATDPIGEHVTVQSRSTGPVPYRVVGVLARVRTAGTPQKGVAARNINAEVYIPLGTADARYGTLKVKFGRGTRDVRRIEYSDVYVAVERPEDVLPVSQAVSRALEHAHKDGDFQVTVPLELLLKAERTKRTWQAVLASIAGISLVVGGIGIMNIMLASVTERTREIGIRRALGAKRHDITAQFLIETLMLSVAGGVIGIVLGIAFAWAVTSWSDIQTVIAWWGVALSFVVSVVVGVSFGLYPARAAAALDPIVALRHE